MARRFPSGSDALSQSNLRSDTLLPCRYKAGTSEDADKSIPFSLIQSTPIAVCSSSSGASSKVATVQNFPDFTLQNGSEIVVYFSDGNSATSPSLNINGTGAIPLDSGYWNAGSFIKVKYVDITVSGNRIQKYLVDAGAYNTTTQLNSSLANLSKLSSNQISYNNADLAIPSVEGVEFFNVAYSATNAPLNTMSWIVKSVKRGTGVHQIAFSAENASVDCVYSRTGQTSNGTNWTFSSWVKLVTTSDLSNFVKTMTITPTSNEQTFNYPSGYDQTSFKMLEKTLYFVNNQDIDCWALGIQIRKANFGIYVIFNDTSYLNYPITIYYV